MGKIYEFEKLEPKAVLTWFKKICSIPHGSFKEKELAEELKKYLLEAGCSVQTLSSGALFIRQKATYGHDNWPIVLLQGHMDMVQVKDDGVVFDFDKDPIKAYYDTEKGWIKAEGTTLGADNGVAIAMFMEILTNPNIEHGPLEALFTVGEESDTTICMNSIPKGLLNAKYYINLDSDHDNTIYYASAGVFRVDYKLPLIFEGSKGNMETYEIDLSKFSGGHSALIIHNPHINPFVFACKSLLLFSNKTSPIQLISADAGVANNAIPTWAKLKIQVDSNHSEELKAFLSRALETARVVAQGNEDGAILKISRIENAKSAMPIELSNKIFAFYAYAPNDMLVVNDTGKSMFNSSNIGLVRTVGSEIISGFFPRSYYKPDLENIANLLAIYAKNNGAYDINIKDSCASWLTPDHEHSFIINLWRENYIKVVGYEPLILPNPGGLEVAEIVTKNEKMIPNAMSTGPIIFKEHSIYENCPVDSINRIWNILQLTLKGLDK